MLCVRISRICENNITAQKKPFYRTENFNIYKPYSCPPTTNLALAHPQQQNLHLPTHNNKTYTCPPTTTNLTLAHPQQQTLHLPTHNNKTYTCPPTTTNLTLAHPQQQTLHLPTHNNKPCTCPPTTTNLTLAHPQQTLHLPSQPYTCPTNLTLAQQTLHLHPQQIKRPWHDIFITAERERLATTNPKEHCHSHSRSLWITTNHSFVTEGNQKHGICAVFMPSKK